jgi:hypothetical protein
MASMIQFLGMVKQRLHRFCNQTFNLKNLKEAEGKD